MNTNKKYKTELHCHTVEMSGCASETAAAMIDKYVACGYTTVVLTNHCEHSRIHAPLPISPART